MIRSPTGFLLILFMTLETNYQSYRAKAIMLGPPMKVDNSGSGSGDNTNQASEITTKEDTLDMEIFSKCPDDWEMYDPYEYCYKVFPDHLSWSQSKDRCKENFAILAYVPDAAADKFLTGLLKIQQHFWFGLIRVQKAEHFVWSDDAPLTAFTRWDEGTPTDIGSCVMYSNPNGNFLWNDVDCATKASYLCQRDATSTGGCPSSWTKHDVKPICYQMFKDDKEIWSDAKQRCLNLFGKLATITDLETERFVLKMSNEEFWIGLTWNRDEYLSTWYAWMGTMEEPGYTNWANPLGDSPDKCVIYSKQGSAGYMWEDKSCDNSYPFVCQRDPAYMVTATCPLNWSLFSNANRQRCVKVIETPLRDFDNAVQACDDQSATLSNIKQRPFNDFLNTHLQGDRYWIGLSKNNGAQSKYRWSHNNNVLGDYTNWDVAPSSTNSRRCVMIVKVGAKYLWQARECSEEAPFLCRKDPSYKTEAFEVSTPTVTAAVKTTTKVMTTATTTTTPAKATTMATTATATTMTATISITPSLTTDSIPTATPSLCAPSVMIMTSTTTVYVSMSASTTSIKADSTTSTQPLLLTSSSLSTTTTATTTTTETETEFAAAQEVYTWCVCQHNLTYDPTPTGDALAQVTSEIQRKLSVNVSSLSATRNKKQSAQDNRPSSQTIGYAAVCLFVIPFVLMIFSDLTYVFNLTGMDPDD